MVVIAQVFFYFAWWFVLDSHIPDDGTRAVVALSLSFVIASIVEIANCLRKIADHHET